MLGFDSNKQPAGTPTTAILSTCVRRHALEPSRDRKGAVLCGGNRAASLRAQLGKGFSHVLNALKRTLEMPSQPAVRAQSVVLGAKKRKKDAKRSHLKVALYPRAAGWVADLVSRWGTR